MESCGGHNANVLIIVIFGDIDPMSTILPPLKWFETFDEMPCDLKGTRLTKSMFPPHDRQRQHDNDRKKDEKDRFQNDDDDKDEDVYALHRAMRFVPQHQNTGGFFVAVLEKAANLPGLNQQGTYLYIYRERERAVARSIDTWALEF
jgi:hypothetical protein